MTDEQDCRSPEYEEWLSDQACHGVFIGGYSFEEERGAWAAWQASRQRLVVKLPESGPWAGYDNPSMMESRDVTCALEEAGVRFE